MARNAIKKNTIIVFMLYILHFAFSVESATWTKKTLPVTNVDLRAVHFLEDGKNGWIVGNQGAVFYTNDAGDTWKQQDSGTGVNLNGVYFSNDRSGCAVGIGGTAIYTTDGGNTWQNAKCDVMNSLFGITFSSFYKGFAVGTNGTIVTTRDGGKTWISLQTSVATDLYGVYAKSNNIWAVGNGGTIVMSSDGGTKWQVKNVEVTDNLYGINFLGSYEGYAAGAFGTIIKSSDSGSTWKLLTKIGGEAIKNIYAIGYSNIWAIVGSGALLHSTDRGRTWNPEAIDTQESLYGGYFADWGGWIVGDNGTVLSCCPISAVFDMSSTEFILGVTSEIIFNFKITVEGNPESWQLAIKDKSDTVFKTFYGYKDISKEIKWDGKSDKGKVIDPGDYIVSFSATDSSGFKSVSPTKTISVKTFKPKLSVFVSPQIFSPSSREETKIIMKMNLDKNDIRTKTFNILKDDKVIKTFINPPDTFKWDGKDNNGKIADPGIYNFAVSIVSNAGGTLESNGVIIVDLLRASSKVLVITLANIFFNNGNATLRPSDEKELSKAAEMIRKYSSYSVQIKGYSDKTETASDLLKVSMDRANAVFDFFINKEKIERQRIIVLAYGSTKSDKSDIRNRKVEILLVAK